MADAVRAEQPHDFAYALDRLPVEWSRWIESLTTPQPGFAAFVAEAGDGMLGWATVGPSAFPEQYGELHGLYVDPDKWARGAGCALLERAEEELALTWADAILWTLEDNPRTRRYTIDSLLEHATQAFGGYDAVVLWHAYPRIGFDQRNQFDFYRDMPGGLAGLLRMMSRVRGVKGFGPKTEEKLRTVTTEAPSARRASGVSPAAITKRPGRVVVRQA